MFIAFGLKQENADVTIVNRSVEKAQEIAMRFGQNFLALEHAAGKEFDIIVNATSVGMHPKIKENIVPEGLLKKGTIVMDVVYNPLETKLLQLAKKKGCKTVPGIEMFILQAAEQFKLWHGKKPDTELMKKVLIKELEK
ncbi:MAG: hypothetical protein Q7K42_03200 [Candidatus Diapherotrites archaeon]|nr:hypothetical protein [Candidatus Diapherotrites archaeon]